MSSGPFTYALGAAAAFVIRSLYERPDRQTAQEIAAADDDVEAADAEAGLSELEQRGLASQDADGRWSLTERGRQASRGA
jgi:hypothetical protein